MENWEKKSMLEELIKEKEKADYYTTIRQQGLNELKTELEQVKAEIIAEQEAATIEE